MSLIQAFDEVVGQFEVRDPGQTGQVWRSPGREKANMTMTSAPSLDAWKYSRQPSNAACYLT